jgi:hypothetical protein
MARRGAQVAAVEPKAPDVDAVVQEACGLAGEAEVSAYAMQQASKALEEAFEALFGLRQQGQPTCPAQAAAEFWSKALLQRAETLTASTREFLDVLERSR